MLFLFRFAMVCACRQTFSYDILTRGFNFFLKLLPNCIYTIQFWMGCCSALVVLTLILWVGTTMYVVGGIYGLSNTMSLFEKYGPVNGK